jgi:prepilin-type N-terminal cleavage/methylation domain-containing protein
MTFNVKKSILNRSGLTLVELIVAIAIVSLSIAGMSIFFIKSWKMNAYIYETGQDSLIASRTVNSMTNNLRRIKQADNGDYPIYSASSFDLVTYVDVDNDGDTEKIHYFLNLNTDTLSMGVSEPSSSNPPTYSSGDDSVQVLSTHVLNNSETPLFSYFGNNYLTDSTPFSVPVSSSEIGNIRMVKVNLWVDIRPYSSPDFITIESFAQFRNL